MECYTFLQIRVLLLELGLDLGDLGLHSGNLSFWMTFSLPLYFLILVVYEEAIDFSNYFYSFISMNHFSNSSICSLGLSMYLCKQPYL